MIIKPTPFIIRKYVLPFILLILIFICGCGAFKQGTFATDDSGAFIGHYRSCGPRAIEQAFREFSHQNISKYSDIEISREIQKNGNILRMTMSVFHQDAMEITWPHEIINFLRSKNFIVEEVSLSDLKAGDIAIVLIKGSITKYHWVTFPSMPKEKIKNFFPERTKIIKALLIKKGAAN